MKRFEQWAQPQPPHDTEIRLARIPSRQIGYLNSIVESYEGVGMIRTRDAGLGLVEFWIIPDFRDEFLTLIEALEKEFPITWVPRTSGDSVFGIVEGDGYVPVDG